MERSARPHSVSLSIKENTGYALAKVCRAHRGNVENLLRRIVLHVGQEMVLIELRKNDGLLTRYQNPKDARSFRGFITEERRSLEELVTHCWGWI